MPQPSSCRLRAALLLSSLAGCLALAGCGSGPPPGPASDGGAASDAPIDEPPVHGRLLYPGPGIEAPRFVLMERERWVLFDVGRTPPADGRGGTADVHAVRFSDGQHVLIMAAHAKRPEWPVLEDASGARFYMTEERQETGRAVGLLRRVSPAGAIVESIADVVAYGVSGQSFWYTKHIAGAALPVLHLHDLAGRDRDLGPVGGSIQPRARDALYYVAGDGTLSVVNGLDGPATALRAHVSRYQVLADGAFVVAWVTDDGQPHTLVLDVAAHGERPLPVDDPCCWLGADGTTVRFATAADGEQAAQLHDLDLPTGTERIVQLPAELADVISLLPRPASSGELLVLDRHERAAIYRPLSTSTPMFEVLPSRVGGPQFTPDGLHLLHVDLGLDPSATEGALVVRDASDWSAAPRRLSPEGVRVPTVAVAGYFLAGSKIFFWGGTDPSAPEHAPDLYIGALDAGASMRVAQAIGQVLVTPRRLVGLWNLDADRIGELRVHDLANQKESLLEHGVSEAAILADDVAFVVRGGSRTSPRNGLWATTLPPLD